MKSKSNLGHLLIFLFGMLFYILLLNIGPIIQNASYHNFTDKTELFGIPNFWNVISNLPFLIVGILGIKYFKKSYKIDFQYLIFFVSILLVYLGSTYYHLFPNNETLVWDRLPMTMVFMALISILISDFFHRKAGKILLIPLLILGISSIVYWLLSGDLRFYVFVQFYPITVIPIILLLFETKYDSVLGYWWLLIAYVIAKFSEYYDHEIFDFIDFSGHSFTIISSLGVFVLLNYYKNRLKQ
jgi:hypothetical protein